MTAEKTNPFILYYLGTALVLTIALYFLFQYASYDLAGKTCLQVTHQLQAEFKKHHSTYAKTMDELTSLDKEIKNPRKPEEAISGIEPRCMDHFQLKVTHANESSFEAEIHLPRHIMKITENGQVTKL
jgi:hypothetical protein